RPNDYLYALKADTFNTFLYAGGMFTRMGNLRSRGIAMWDGFKWNSMHYEYGSTVGQKAIAIYRGDVYTGSNFTYDEATDTYNYFIARWNGESWDSIGGNFDDTMGAIEVFQNEIYIGGGFRTYNGGQRNKGLVKLTMPDNGCNYIKPRINTFADTVYLGSGASTSSATAEMHFFNNNPYVDTWTWDFGDGGTADIKDPVHTYTDSGTYVVKITVTHEGCSKSYEKTIRIEADTTSSVASYANIDFQIFPNPSSGNFTVKMDTHRSLSISVSEPRLLSAVEVSRTAETTLNSTIELRIHGTNGHLTDIIPVTSDETIINTQNWKPGTYICNLFIDGKLIRTEKLILK
ncbi:MAG: PKD domain-containing protein, partial [Bacteroidales bacterium]|nr:PKD domain-containing protein [Bacteroidales bacterium]